MHEERAGRCRRMKGGLRLRVNGTSRFWRLRPVLGAKWILCFMLLALRCFAVQAARAEGAVPLSHQAWSTEEGLPQASVHQILQSREGFLWLATEGGAARFDGLGFEVLRHETDAAFISDDVTALAQDRAGHLWFGTADGLIEQVGKQSAPGLHRFAERNGLPSAGIVSLAAAEDGSLLALTTGGVVRFDGARFGPLPRMNTPVTSLVQAADGSVFLLCGRAVWRYRRGSVTRVAAPEVTEPILDFEASSQTTMWMRTAHAVTLTGAGTQRTWRVGHELPGSHLETLQVDREGTAWVGTDRGLFTLTAEDAGHLTTVDVLRAEAVLSILEDREGNVWVGTETSGLHVLRPRSFRSETAAFHNAVSSVIEASDGAMWFGTRDDGVRRIAHDRVDTPVPASALTSPVVLSMAPGLAGDVWVGTPDGLNHIQHGAVRKYIAADGLPDEFVRSVLVDRRGTVWIGTRYGLAKIENGKIVVATQANGLGSDAIGSLLLQRAPTAAEDALWVATAAGLSRVRDGKTATFPGQAAGSGEAAGASAIVTALAEDASGAIWVGLHGQGLNRFADGRFARIASSELPSEISALAVDEDKQLWVLANHRLSRVPVAALDACATGRKPCALKAKQYGVLDGMPTDEILPQGFPYLTQTTQHELWVATRKGIAVAEPAHLARNAVPPPVALERFAIDDVAQPLTATIQAAAKHQRYTFDYVGLSYTMPSRTRYRYMLEGLDRGWIDAGSRRTAYYTSLPAGAYRFRVLAANNDGVWNEGGAEVSFAVLPPFYQTLWFYALLVLTLAAGVLLLLRLRVQRIERRFALVLGERNRVAREIHDTLAQDLVSVSLQLQLVSQLVKTDHLPQATLQLEETRSLVKKGLESARQSIWNLRANTAGDDLPARLQAAVKRYAQRHTAPELKIGGAFRKLPVNLEDEVMRIAEESLSNIDRHAAAERVTVELRYDRDTLLLAVRDDGRGFAHDDARELEGHYGLRGMRERAAILHAEMTIISKQGEGTCVRLIVPLGAGEGAAKKGAGTW